MVFIPITPMEPMKFTPSAQDRPASHATVPFQNVLSEAIGSMEQAQRVADGDGYRLALGEVDDLAQVQINAMKAESMVQTTVQLTTRIVNAYKEIMQMQV